jgi:hypothetical protein
MNGLPPVKLLSRATLAAAALLTYLHVYICRDLFRTEYLSRMDSIEGSYIGISRYILNHPRDLGWFPLWYGGIPFQNTYPPLLHMLVAGTAWMLKVSPALAHHIVGATLYCLGPVALMFLAYALSNNLTLSWASSLLYSLWSPSAFLMPSIRTDLISVWNPRRLQALAFYGDSPHVSSITLLLIAVLTLHLAVERRGPSRVLAAAVMLAAVVLTNWLGAFSLAIACASYLLARVDEDSKWAGMLAFSAGIGVLAYGLAAPWIPPSTIETIQKNMQLPGQYPMGVRQLEYAFLLLAAGAALRWILKKSGASLCVRFSSYFLLVMAALALPADWFHVYLMPQPDRYHLELEIGVCLVGAFVLGRPVMNLARRSRVGLVVLAAAVLVFGAIQTRTYRKFFKLTTHSIDIHQTVEYESAQWLQQNLPGRRVFAEGSTRFWLNAFCDNPQVGGGFDQGNINPEIPILKYGIPYTQGDGAITAMWLRLLGAGAVIVSGPGSRDAYPHDWHDPEKFKGVLPELWRDGGDAIYGVPQRGVSLAHVILSADVVAQGTDRVENVEAVRKLDAALENFALPVADFTWKNPSEAAVSATLQPEHVVMVQVSYHPGWRASVDGSARPLRRDGLGFMIIEPQCNGPCQIRLLYDGGTEMRVAQWVSALTAIGLLIACVWRWRSRGVASL